LNHRGEIVEGTYTNVWIRRRGQLLTPRLDASGLCGVYRAHLLATSGNAAEAVLHPEDLASAEAVMLSNAVRGLVPVRLVAVEHAVG
jgi:branched-subunit amino acid aminotransferase/4-amino-4-deoxychorismate lyase